MTSLRRTDASLFALLAAVAAGGVSALNRAQTSGRPVFGRYKPARGWRKTTLHKQHGERECLRYARNHMHEQQQRSHAAAGQAMNPHLRAHLFGVSS